MVFLFLIPYMSTYYAKSFIPRQIWPSINVVYNGIDPNNNLDIQRFFHLHIPTIYYYLIGIAIQIPMGRFFDTMIDVD